MIRWCSFCQKYMGEIPPYTDYTLTHGICPSCQNSVTSGKANLKKIEQKAHEFKNLREDILHGMVISPKDLIKKAEELQISTFDFLYGLLQPLLYQIGELYSQGKISIEKEHLFTYSAEQVIRAAREEWVKNGGWTPKTPQVDILLVCADGNYHTLGLQMLEVALLERGYKVRVIIPGLPVSEVMGLIFYHRPKVLGVSVSMEEHLGFMKELAKELKKSIMPRPKVLLGGSLLKEKVISEEGVDYAFSPYDFLSFFEYLSQLVKGVKGG